MGKSFVESKTVIINVLTILVSVGGALVGNEFISAHPKVVAAIAGTVAVANVLLRVFKTSEPITSVRPK